MLPKEIMAEIKKIKPIADTVVSEDPRETYQGRSARQRKAKEQLKGLVETYRQSVLKSAVFTLVTGPGREAFGKAAKETFRFPVVDADQFYSDIANQVSPKLYDGKESSPGVLDVVGRVLENKALDVGILGYPMLVFRQEHRRVIRGREEFKQLVKQIISTQVGTEVVAAQAVKSSLNDLIQMEVGGNTISIILLADTIEKTLVDGLLRVSGKVVTATINETEITPLHVTEVLNGLKKQRDSNPGSVASYTLDVEERKAETTEYGTEQSTVVLNGGVITQEILEEAAAKLAEQGGADSFEQTLEAAERLDKLAAGDLEMEKLAEEVLKDLPTAETVSKKRQQRNRNKQNQ